MLAPEQTKIAEDAYTNLFASRLPILSKTIDEDAFLAFQGAWVDDEDLEPQDVARIIGNRQIKNISDRLEQEKKTQTDEERDLIIKPMVEESKIQKKETQELKANVISLDKKVSTLQGKISVLESRVGRQNKILTWLGHFVGAVIFVVFWFVLYQYVLINSLTPWQAFLGAIALAAIFGYLADFHGYKWLVDKLMGRGLITDNSPRNSE